MQADVRPHPIPKSSFRSCKEWKVRTELLDCSRYLRVEDLLRKTPEPLCISQMEPCWFKQICLSWGQQESVDLIWSDGFVYAKCSRFSRGGASESRSRRKMLRPRRGRRRSQHTQIAHPPLPTRTLPHISRRLRCILDRKRGRETA